MAAFEYRQAEKSVLPAFLLLSVPLPLAPNGFAQEKLDLGVETSEVVVRPASKLLVQLRRQPEQE